MLLLSHSSSVASRASCWVTTPQTQTQTQMTLTLVCHGRSCMTCCGYIATLDSIRASSTLIGRYKHVQKCRIPLTCFQFDFIFSCVCILYILQLHQYQYYSIGLLSTHDPFYEQQRHLLGPKKKKIKDEKKFKGKTNIYVEYFSAI